MGLEIAPGSLVGLLFFVAVPVGERIRHSTPAQARRFGVVPEVQSSNLIRNRMVSG